jgi:hypothetical protein
VVPGPSTPYVIGSAVLHCPLSLALSILVTRKKIETVTRKDPMRLK